MKLLVRILCVLVLLATPLIGYAQETSSDSIPPGIAFGSTATRINYAQTHGLIHVSEKPSPGGPSPDTLGRPGMFFVNNDGLQDVEPTTITINKSGQLISSVVWMSDPGNANFTFKFAAIYGGLIASGSLPGDGVKPYFADPMLDANFQSTGVAPGRLYCTGINADTLALHFDVRLWSSDDGGQHWSAGTVVASENGGVYDLDHPAVTVTQSNGYLYVVYSRIHIMHPEMSELYVKRSTDGGLTFGPAVCIAGSTGVVPVEALRAPQIVSDPGGVRFFV